MEKINIFEIETERKFNSWEKEFDCFLDDDETAFFVSLETFKSRDDAELKSFDYVYAIECLRDYDNNRWFYSLHMVPDKRDIKKELIENVASTCCVRTDEVNFYDIVSYGGLSVSFGCATSNGEEIDYDIITQIAHVYRTMDALRGFYLDKTWNAIGCDGWDILCHALNGDDLFKPTLERSKSK